ncbi:MAG: ABC transporter permease subunit, partial [Xanthobacteraceae bacterium]
MIAALNARNLLISALLTFLVLLPVYANLSGNYFLLTLFTRILILALAATSLNLILGYGGMVSFGHAAYLGIGGYAIGILASEGVTSGFVQWPVALAVSALAALVIGLLCLRTRGVYFIMITLAFAQMLFYLANSVKGYGGDEGLNIRARSLFSLGAPRPTTHNGAVVALTTLVALAVALPFVLRAFGLDFYLSLASRIVVYAIAATSLNLVLGYGGMISFGHAAFVGTGAYVASIFMAEGIT